MECLARVAVHSVKLALHDFSGFVMNGEWMHVEQLKEDVREGRIDPDRLVELVVTLQRAVAGGASSGSRNWKSNWAARRRRKSASRFRCGRKNSGRKHAGRSAEAKTAVAGRADHHGGEDRPGRADREGLSRRRAESDC